MLLDGQQVAAEIAVQTESMIASLSRPPRALIVSCAPGSVTRRYLDKKQAHAERLGIELTAHIAPSTATTDELIAVINEADAPDGVVVQLPLPPHIDTATVVAAIPPERDVDALQIDSPFGAPVAEAIAAMLQYYQITVAGTQVVVLGAGRLVGAPVARWFRAAGASVTVITEDTPDPAALRAADIVVSGVGKPGLLQPDMVKPGVVIFDAGTAEAGGELRGDVDPACQEVASYMTPVPGGIGPVTIAILLQHIAAAALERQKIVRM